MRFSQVIPQSLAIIALATPVFSCVQFSLNYNCNWLGNPVNAALTDNGSQVCSLTNYQIPNGAGGIPLSCIGGYSAYMSFGTGNVVSFSYPGFSGSFGTNFVRNSDSYLTMHYLSPSNGVDLELTDDDTIGWQDVLNDDRAIGFSREEKISDQNRGQEILTRIKQQYSLRASEGRHPIVENLALAPIAHIISIGDPGLQYIITSSNPPLFGCPTRNPQFLSSNSS